MRRARVKIKDCRTKRWRDGRVVRYRLADQRVSQLLELGRALLADNAEHVAACGRIGGGC